MTCKPASYPSSVLAKRGVERSAIGHRDPSLALDGERAPAGCGGGREPRVARPVVLDQERRGEDVAGARRIDLVSRPRPHLVPPAVDEEERAIAVGGEGAERHVLEPLDDRGLLAAHVLARQKERLDPVQEGLRRLPGARRDESVAAHVAQPPLCGGADRAL